MYFIIPPGISMFSDTKIVIKANLNYGRCKNFSPFYKWFCNPLTVTGSQIW